MAVYISALIVSLLLAKTRQGRKGLRYINNKEFVDSINDLNRPSMKYGFILTALPFIIVSCCRFDVGTDYYTYTTFYPELVLTTDFRVEPIFDILIHVAVDYLDNTHFIIVFFGLLYSALMYKFIYEYTSNIYLSILFFFLSGCFNYSLNAMRQMLAVAIFFVSLKYIENNDYKRYYINMIIALCIHGVSLFFFPFYFIDKLKLNKYFALIIPILMLLIVETIRPVLMWIMEMFNFYSGYFNSVFDFQKPSYSLIAICLTAFLLSYYQKYYQRKTKLSNIIFNIQLCSLLFAEWVSIIPNGSRVVYLLLPMQCVTIPNSVMLFKRGSTRMILCMLLFVLYSVFFIFYYYIRNYEETFPYQFIF